jgi:hypothetical protein
MTCASERLVSTHLGRAVTVRGAISQANSVFFETGARPT